jgi:hypothetical protein
MAKSNNARKLEKNPAGTEYAVATSVPAGKITTSTVVVALNHPQGIHFTLPEGKRVTIQGNASPLRGKGKGTLPIGAYGLTTVAADDWAAIEKIYGNMEIFKNGLIFARSSLGLAEGEAAEKEELRHGREPVDPATTNTEEAKNVGGEM